MLGAEVTGGANPSGHALGSVAGELPQDTGLHHVASLKCVYTSAGPPMGDQASDQP
jgi:hypothetical protein